MKPTFFATPAQLRAWFERHHATRQELLLGYWKKGTGKPSVTWPESVDEALCFGWIDGVRRSLGEEAYVIRFTPRRPTSIWSVVNLRRVEQLTKEGRMTEAGLATHRARRAERTALYSIEQRSVKFTAEQEAALRRNARAAAFFDAQPPWYRRAATHWVTSAKKEETRAKRLRELVADSAAGRTVKPLTRPGGKA